MDGPSDKNLRVITVESQGTVGLNWMLWKEVEEERG